jgi:16S rRNA (cytosine967-C5)-methyltransferase
MAFDTRAAAATVVGEVLDGRSLKLALPPYLERVSARDRGLLQELSYGTLRLSPRLLAFLQLLLAKPLRERDRDIQGLLLCGLYQLEATRIPDHAAVAATVEATRALNKPWARGLCNAVLRRFQRERSQLLGALSEAEARAHPAWLYRMIQLQWPAAAAAIVDANNRQPPMTLRVNGARLSRDAYLATLAEQGIAARAGTLSPQAVCLARPADVDELPGFAAGLVSVQDEAAQLAAPLLQAAPGERVLDACAAPGGKACHMLELQPRLARLVAMDADGQRLQKVQDNLRRLGLEGDTLAGDATHPPPRLARAGFDRILVDAPCSAAGVIRRHPDTKLLRRAGDIPRCARQQLAILSGVWPLLKTGGRLLYATCSILEEENSQVVQRFLATNPGAALLPLAGEWGEETPCGRQLLPTAEGSDGLFYALLEKQG